MSENIRKNEKCFIGMPSCGYVHESAKLCFVAAPSDDKYTMHVNNIKRIVESNHYECHIALKKIDPGNFAFCTKICSKIIQSQFCIVLLDPSENDKNKSYPNPNVHLEYGMMMSMNKYIIPLQSEKYKLPFNISPLDTLKYSEPNFESKLTEAILQAITKFSEKKIPDIASISPELYTFYNIRSLKLTDVTIEKYRLIYNLGAQLNFSLFNSIDNFVFVGNFLNEDPKHTIMLTKLLINDLSKSYKKAISIASDDMQVDLYKYLKENISLDLIIPNKIFKEDFEKKLKSVITNDFNYPINIYNLDDIADIIQSEYDKIGDL